MRNSDIENMYRKAQTEKGVPEVWKTVVIIPIH